MHANHQAHKKWGAITTALIFIVVGILFLGRNLGWVSDEVFHEIVSWQMLLIVIGIVQLIRRNIVGGLVLVFIGGFFLIPSDYGLGAYWPVILIIIGIAMLFKFLTSRSLGKWSQGPTVRTTDSEDGFVEADVSFGASQHIVLEPVFRGAHLDASFGNILLDLRKTNLDEEETYIDIDCSFGGIEVYLPSTWNVIVNVNNNFGGIHDKRRVGYEIDNRHKLIFRGEISFGGLELKS
ncbi:cell wall-active antibiotics response protein [Parabacteroides sp. OttesenSCG-928-K15]|nr:cell wall-active antibiotics response protein [Parabacteroides sp. OttesenSCG-928-K15]